MLYLQMTMKTLVFLGPIFYLLKKCGLYKNIEELIISTLFLATISSYSAFIFSYFLQIPSYYFLFVLLYFLFAAPWIKLLHNFSLDSQHVPTEPKWYYAFLFTLFLVFISFYGLYSRPVPSNGGAIFTFLDALRFSDENKFFYPQFPREITLSNALVTSCNIYQGFLILLGKNTNLEGYMLANAYSHGLFSFGTVASFLALSRRFFKTPIFGLLILPFIYLAPEGVIFFNMAMAIPGQEQASYFYSSFITYYALKILSEERNFNEFEFGILTIALMSAVISRPYFFASCLILTFCILIHYARSIGLDKFFILIKKNYIFFALAILIFSSWHISLILKYGTPFPISRVQTVYNMFEAGLMTNFKNAASLFLQMYFPFIKAAIFPAPTNEIFNFNEVTPIVSFCAFIGLIVFAYKLFQKHHFQIKPLSILLFFSLTFSMTAVLFIPMNRIFHYMTPTICLIAIYGIANLKSTRFIPLLIALAVFFVFYLNSGVSYFEKIQNNFRWQNLGDQISYQSSLEYSRMVAREITSLSRNVQVMKTGLEPGLDDMYQTPGMYYWSTLSFPSEIESVFENLNWDHKKCIEYLRKNRILIISTHTPVGASFSFLKNDQNSKKFWELIQNNPDIFTAHKTASHNYYNYRTLYVVSER